jgi:hypothetical protein
VGQSQCFREGDASIELLGELMIPDGKFAMTKRHAGEHHAICAAVVWRASGRESMKRFRAAETLLSKEVGEPT